MAFPQGAAPEVVCPLPEILSKSDRKISIAKEISITMDFAAPLPEKIPGRKQVSMYHKKIS